tara:strand:- start:1828 stop:2427 length:600 start_codon:yes stop_codon:yes gene_type:complete
MLIIPKTQIAFETEEWLNKLKFKNHTDYDLKDNCSAIAVKSESGSVYDFYRTNPVEDPDDFKYTQLYYKVKEIREIVDYFNFLETTRVRIHKTDPQQVIDLHTDGNNDEAKTQEDYRLRIITALNENEDFIYTYEFEGEQQNILLEKGQSIIFDPDKVKHGLINNSKTKTRYALVQIFKAYPVHRELIQFINSNEIVIL